MLTTSKTNYKILQYYSNCDFINKFNLTSVYKKPILKQLILELPLDKIDNSFFSKASYNTEQVQIIGFLLFYIISSWLPFVNFNKSNFLNTIEKNNFSLKIVFTNEYRIYSFLHDIYEKLFIENEDIKNIQFNNIMFVKICKANDFFEFDSFLSKHTKNINSKELDFYLKFNFKNSIKLKSIKNLIKNFPFLCK